VKKKLYSLVCDVGHANNKFKEVWQLAQKLTPSKCSKNPVVAGGVAQAVKVPA
jgi:hypothetical protein